MGQNGENTINNNGQRLIELCQQNALRIMNGWFKHKQIHQYTWIQPTRNLKSIIDYIILRQKTKLWVKDVRVLRGPECGSDHHLLVSRVFFPFKGRKDFCNVKEGEKMFKIDYNLQNLQEDSTCFLYKMRLATKLCEITDDSANNMYEMVKKKIHESAFEALGEKEQRTWKKKNAMWWNETVEKLVHEKKMAYNKWLTTKSDEDLHTYRHKRKDSQRAVVAAKNEAWHNVGEDIEKCFGNTRANKAWRILKKMRKQNNDSAGISLISMEK